MYLDCLLGIPYQNFYFLFENEVKILGKIYFDRKVF